MNATYLAVSLPPTFDPAGENLTARVLKQCVLPTAAEAGRPMALMIGVKKLLNPHLQLAGDSSARRILVPSSICVRNFRRINFWSRCCPAKTSMNCV